MIQCEQLYAHFLQIWKHLLIWLKKISEGRELNVAYVMTKKITTNWLQIKIENKSNAIILPTLIEPYLITYWKKNVMSYEGIYPAQKKLPVDFKRYCSHHI